ncbi:pfs protein (plasmid) [Borreliella burgdorferi Bol26]|uniref:hypothetical protein n=1 Tax=Borreliella burgdorferi TaxID=139 RepID=UPI00016B30DA|nr:hypothetical protein [Borreliella burgdorferi]ACO38087.1 pfs protein [Borreliella burgdorferi Bol26]
MYFFYIRKKYFVAIMTYGLLAFGSCSQFPSKTIKNISLALKDSKGNKKENEKYNEEILKPNKKILTSNPYIILSEQHIPNGKITNENSQNNILILSATKAKILEINKIIQNKKFISIEEHIIKKKIAIKKVLDHYITTKKELYKQHNYLNEKHKNSLYTQINLINFFYCFCRIYRSFSYKFL